MSQSQSQLLPVPRWLLRRMLLWQKRCELEHWQITIQFTLSLPAEIVAQTGWSRGYHSATMEFSKAWYEKLNEREMDWFIAHELYHLMAAQQTDSVETGRVQKRLAEENERLAERFASVMMRAYKRKPV